MLAKDLLDSLSTKPTKEASEHGDLQSVTDQALINVLRQTLSPRAKVVAPGKIQDIQYLSKDRHAFDSDLEHEVSGFKHEDGGGAPMKEPTTVVVRREDGSIDVLASGLRRALDSTRGFTEGDGGKQRMDGQSDAYADVYATRADIRARFDHDNEPDEDADAQNRSVYAEDEYEEEEVSGDEADSCGNMHDRTGRILTDAHMSVRQESKYDFPMAYRDEVYVQRIDGVTGVPIEQAFPEYFEHGGGLIAHGNPWEHSATVCVYC
jgi:hypothetical protein